MSDLWQDEKYSAVQARVQNFFSGLIAEGELGRSSCAHEEDWSDCEDEECRYTDTVQKKGGQMVTEFIVILNYVNLEANDADFGTIESTGMYRSHRVGLLTCALEVS